MAEGGLSRSAEAGLDKPGKPGKLSHELLNKFVSDPVLTRPQSLPVGRLSAQSFLSSSEEIATSHENLNSKKAKVQIKVPDENEEHLSPSSADEDMLSDDDAGKETKKKKRKLRWKWSPFKKMKRLFRRKKSPTRAMSCEELPTECFKATNLSTNVEDDDSLRNRVKSEPALAEAKIKTPLAAIEVYERRNTADSPVYRTNSDPSSKTAGKLLKGLKTTQDKSQVDISEEPAMSSDSSHSFTAGLDWSVMNSDSGTEAAVSFEDLPSASSLEGLQVAHDRIKVAPKHRRPPTRVQPRSSSMNLKGNSVKPHRRSKTDPKDLTVKPGVETEQGARSTRNSDVISGTIFEASEVSDEQSKESVVADLKLKANEILTSVPKSPNGSSKAVENETEEKESQMLTNGEKDLQSSVTDSTAEIEQVKQKLTDGMDNVVINKENKGCESEQNLRLENLEEEAKGKEKVLKEINGKKEGSRPLLDVSRRTESLSIFEVMSKSKETEDKPPLRRGFSLKSFESKEKPADLKLTKLVENEKQPKTVCAQNSAEKINEPTSSQLESKGPIPEKVSPGAKVVKKASVKEESSGQPSWIELANKKSQRLSQLIGEGGKEDNQALLKVATGGSSTPASARTNADNKPTPVVKEKPKVPAKPEGLSHKPAPLPRPRSKTFSGTTEKKEPLTKQVSQDKTSVHAHVDKCAVCGTTVYHMEKCNFDNSVLHRQCIKCTVCKRPLTVGNFVIAESKVYCKPHAKTLTVST